MEADFSGYATKAGLKCSDGRTIMPDAFKHCDGMSVPLVWQHGHHSPDNVLGHAVLEYRNDGVYAYGYFNDTSSAVNAKTLVQHKDITALSIYANQLVERGKQVFHGMIRELSLVLSGANPGALIDNVSFAHSDGQIEVMDDEAIIYTGLTLEHADQEDEELVHEDDQTIQDVYESLSEEQKNVLHYMVGAALEEASGKSVEQSASQDEKNLTHQEGNDDMPRNVFEQTDDKPEEQKAHTLSHDDMKGIVADAAKSGSLKHAVEAYALAHGITNIDLLFPEARAVTTTPDWDKRRTEWVSSVLGGTRKSPFSRIKSWSADLTMEEARAKGYVTGALKTEEFFSVARRITTPTTIYKKQKLDRDDIVDIVDFDVVAWMRGEMRMMLDEELARAVLIGDGRTMPDPDKIDEGSIRPVAKDDPLYTTQVVSPAWVTGTTKPHTLTDLIVSSRVSYKGTGAPTFYTTEVWLTRFLLERDADGRRLYRTVDELAQEMRVAAIIPVEVLEEDAKLIGIMVNLSDYTLGADKGGEVNMFDDFDIDYNQYKYLIETRVSGALTKLKSAVVFKTP